MKALLIILFLGITVSHSQYWLGDRIPLDSAGYVSLINPAGDRITDWKRFDEVTTETGLPYFKTKKYNKWGLADTSLNMLTTNAYSEIYRVKQYLFCENHSSMTVLNMELDTLLQIEDFSRIEFDPKNNRQSHRYKANWNIKFKIIIHTFDGTGVLDENLKWIVEPIYDDAFFMDNTIYTRKGDKFGFITLASKIIEPTYSTISSFDDRVLELKDDSGHRHYFLQNGEKFPDSDSTLVYDRMYSNYKIYKNGKGELIDINLESLIEHSFDDVFQIRSSFKIHGFDFSKSEYSEIEHQKTIFAFRQNDKVGACDQTGRILIPAQYEHVNAAFENYFIVKTNELYGVIDDNNRFIIQPTFTFIQFYKTYFRVHDFKKKGILNAQADTLVPIEFSEIKFMPEGFMTLKNSKKGFYSYEGKKILNNDFTKAHKNNGGLEFESAKGKCMVSLKGLLTPTNCSHVYRTNNKIKYYHGGKIHLGEIVEEEVVNTTSYPMSKSLYIDDRWNDIGISMGTDPCLEYQSQLNSKFGSKNNLDTLWSLSPTYDNIHHYDNSTRLKKPYSHSFKMAGTYFNTKEVSIQFYAGTGRISKDLLSYFGRANSRTWHSSVFDPNITLDHEFEYYSVNSLQPGPAPFMLKRFGFNAITFTEGDFNMRNGQDVIRLREFYTDMNESHNYEITGQQQFGRLSQNQTIKVVNPTWRVQMIEEDHSYNLVGNFEEYRELSSGVNLIKEFDGGYNLIVAGNERLLEEDARDIKVIQKDEFLFYLVLYPNNLGQLKWHLYNASGEVLNTAYDEIEMIEFNYFKVRNGELIQLINKKSEVIYSMGSNDNP